MRSILSNNYSVCFKSEGYSELNKYLLNKQPSSIFLLVDENTHEHCLPIVLQQIETEVVIEIIEIEAGEEFKNIDTCSGVWNALTELGCDRKSLIINIGGGVITDLGGFVASTFKRGVDFINIPTTLLSMVDASVGGKTGIDLGVLKNQIGIFSNPELVIIDSHFLHTITNRELISGLAEIIKYGLTFDAAIWNDIIGFNELNVNNLSELIHRSIEIKNEVVLKDPKEANLRKVLNFGHTLGHAIESYFLENESKENLTHGEAIAIGMVTESYLSMKLMNFDEEKLKLVKETIIKIYGLVSILESDYEPIIKLLIHDKKNVGGAVKFVLLKDFEKFSIDCEASNELIIEALNYYSS